MNESPEWQSPAGSTGSRDAAPPPPPFSAPGASAAPSLPPLPGWTPPPKPGLIPLRPLDLGAILGAAFKTMRHNPKPTLGAALLVQGGVTVLSIGIIGLVTYLSLSRLDNASTEAKPELLAGSVATIVLAAIVPVFLSIAASALLQGIIVLDVMRASLGEKPRLRQLLAMARGRIWAIVGWTLLVALAVGVGFGVIILLIVLVVVMVGGIGGVVAAVLLGIFGGLSFTALWVWLNTKLSLVPSVLMAERASIRTAMKRSWALTNRSFWKTFGIELLVTVIIGVATQVVTTPISLITGMLGSLADPNGQNPATAITGALGSYLVLIIITVLFGAIGAVIQSSTIALIYIDLRMRKEGLDLDLTRFVEARQSGAVGLSDPYARVPAAAPGSPTTAPPAPPAPQPPSNESP
ncbi:MAG: hypothetical protein ABI400_10800 [Lacisediminihabitans sp.]